MPDIVKVSWSGGKDSTAALHLHLMRGDTVKAVCYIPYLTNDIPLILKKQFDFILQTSDLFRSLGAEINFAYGITYYDYVTKVSSRGKRKGMIFGFPCIDLCGFRRDSKIIALDDLDVGYFDYKDIGIAIDECDRNKLFQFKYGDYQYSLFDPPPEDDGRVRSICAELGMTKSDNLAYCKKNGILSPRYEDGMRDGCALCYNAKQEERDQYFSDYPEAIPVVLELQEIVKRERPGNYPLRDHKMFIEQEEANEQGDFF